MITNKNLSKIVETTNSFEFKRIYKSNENDSQNEMNILIDEFTKKKIMILIETIEKSIFGFIVFPNKKKKKSKQSTSPFGRIYFVSIVDPQQTAPQIIAKKDVTNFISNHQHGENGFITFDNAFTLTPKQVIRCGNFKESFTSVFDLDFFIDFNENEESVEVKNIQLFEWL